MTKPDYFRRGFLIAGVGATAWAVTGCSGSDDDNLDDRLNLSAPKIRLVHALAGGPAVSLVRNGADDSAAANIPYQQATQYYDIGTGQTNVAIRGGPGNPQLASASFDASRGRRYSLLAVPGSNLVDLLVIDDPFNKSIASDNARLRAFNASAGRPNLDVYVTAPTQDLNAATPNLPAVAYKSAVPASGQDSVEVEGGNYRLRVTEAGTKNVIFDRDILIPQNGDWLLVTLPDSLLNDNRIRVLVVRSDNSADPTDELQSA